MSTIRKLLLSLLLILIVASGIFLRDAWIWVTVALAVVFFIGLLWPGRKTNNTGTR
ncbi:hypothetical protein J2Y69_002158 [Microbacterium resistens]|uniref:Uncharacterized protein n=1 Tax=Microbacterium resistens TaxID=156977 RepID=A0ABU1SD87_9MICO|nr:hypothetical protein [Microbacterium resistens]MDR6867554.1 hypothetical protein [Microbacterium resistens]